MKIICSIAKATALMMICVRPAAATPQHQALRAMDHTMWTARDGAPQAIRTLAQDPDGTLWIGSENGLVNFDGQRFRLFESPPGDPAFPTAPVESLLITRDGTLWVGFIQAGAARIRAGRVTVYDHAEAVALQLVVHLCEARDGAIWAVANHLQLIRFDRDGAWHVEEQPQTIRIFGIFIDASNTLWLAQGGVLYRRSLEQRSYTRTNVPADITTGFAQAQGGRIWMTDILAQTTRGRTQLFDNQGNVVSVLPFTALASGLVYGSDGSLIVATREQGVRRFSAKELSGASGHDSQPDVLTRELGLSSNAMAAAQVDSHGNIWVGGARGLDRLRPLQLMPFDTTGDSTGSMVCASKHGELWIAGSTNVLYKMSLGTRTPVPGVGGIYSLTCADGDRAWFLDHNGVSAVAAGTVTRIPPIAGVRQTTQMMRVSAASDHTLYANVNGTAENGGGIWRYRDGQWTRLPGEGLLSVAGLSLYLDSQDRLWTGWTQGRVLMHAGDRAQLFSSGAPDLGWVWALLETSRGFFAGGNGLAVLRGSQFVPLGFADPAFVRGVRGIVESRNGDLWLNAASGIAHVPLAELEVGLANPSYPMKAILISEGDFAGAGQSRNSLTETAARDSDGSLWFATRNGVVSLDPEGSGTAARLPIVTIRSITADRRLLDDGARVPPGSRSMEIEYIGVNLTAPEKVTYRYRLEGFDQSWHDAGTRTAAIYTRLPPGTYTLNVMASNGDGRWTDPIASRSFTVLPSLYQTRWFAAAVAVTVLLVLFAIHRIRVRQISRVLSARLDERVAERTRVARELHDTLLQSFHGVMFRFQAASNVLPERPLDAKQRLETALRQGTQAIREGRDAVQGLRDSTVITNDLALALRALGEELAASEGNGADGRTATVDVAIQGTPQALRPIVRDDIYRIGSEALRNAFRHARARRIEVEIRYDARQFQLRVRDDGQGIDGGTLDARRAGHFGLPGMHERAEQIGGQVEVWSKAGMGTEVALTIPGATVYASPRARRHFWSFAGRRQADS
jgi:signal transduction histidine kinase/streptogramin lyase